MNNKLLLKVSIGAIILVLILIAAVFSTQRASKDLSVVYMATGEVYVGKLTTFPKFVLRDGYQFQTVPDPQDPSKTTSQIIPVSDAVWAPKELRLNTDQIVFHGPLSESSQLLGAIKAEKEEPTE